MQAVHSPQQNRDILRLRRNFRSGQCQVFGLEHNHHYTFGRRVILWTDHKPLVSIYKKPLTSAPKRLQRLLLRLQQYDVDLRYKPGSEMYLADTLSRAFLKNTIQSKAEEEAETIHAIDFLPISEPQLREIQVETAQDDTLQRLKETIISGWPDTKKEVPTCLHPYFLIRDSFIHFICHINTKFLQFKVGIMKLEKK